MVMPQIAEATELTVCTSSKTFALVPVIDDFVSVPVTDDSMLQIQKERLAFSFSNKLTKNLNINRIEQENVWLSMQCWRMSSMFEGGHYLPATSNHGWLYSIYSDVCITAINNLYSDFWILFYYLFAQQNWTFLQVDPLEFFSAWLLIV